MRADVAAQRAVSCATQPRPLVLPSMKRPIPLADARSNRATRDRNRKPTTWKVSARMRAVRQRHTAPEIAVRQQVHSLGVGFRTCRPGLPGRPDIQNAAKGWCIFVHGCFWHGHNCRRGRLPKVNRGFWRPKIARNRLRDVEVAEQLRTLGFRVLTVWQCELDRPGRLRHRLSRFLYREA